MYKPRKTKGRAERLAEIRAGADRPAGTYHTNILRWTCSCPAYLISRFLTCKHIVHQVNQRLNNKPLTDLEFFAKLRRQHSPPFFQIEDIYFTLPAPETVVSIPRTVLRMLADVNLHASRAAGSAEDAIEDATGEQSSEPDTTISRAGSPQYCNTSGLEEGNSSGVEEGAGSEVGCENDCGSAFNTDGSTDDGHVRRYYCIFHSHFSDTYSIGLLHHCREEILEEKLGCDGRCLQWTPSSKIGQTPLKMLP